MYSLRFRILKSICVIALAVIFFALSVNEAFAWPWRSIWANFSIENKTGVTCNRILGGNASLFRCRGCLKDGDPKFPSCWQGGMPIGMFGIGNLNGYYFGTEATPPGVKRKIGFKFKFCAALLGAGVWLDNNSPKGWFPLAKFKCTSPISIGIDDSLPGPVSVVNVEYAVGSDVIPHDDLDFDSTFLVWNPTDVVNVTMDPGDSVYIGGVPDDIGDSILFLRGFLIATVEGEQGFYDDTVTFVAEVLDDPGVPALTNWGLLILILLLIVSAIYLFMQKRRKTATA